MAGGYMSLPPSMKMKRKDVDDVSDDFSDFSLSSPARKIRRLEAELPPIMEEDEIESNQERAIVLFNPHQQLHSQSPSSNFSVSLNPAIISGFKNQIFRLSSQSGQVPESGDQEDGQGVVVNACKAMVPWTRNSYPYAGQVMVSDDNDNQTEGQEMMEAEATMEIDDDENNSLNNNDGSFQPYGFDLSQWQQQHCMIPELPRNTTTPITWFQ